MPEIQQADSRGSLRYRPVDFLLLCATVGAVGAYVAAKVSSPVYESKAVIWLVNHNDSNIRIPNLAAWVKTDEVLSRASSMVEQLESAPDVGKRTHALKESIRCQRIWNTTDGDPSDFMELACTGPSPQSTRSSLFAVYGAIKQSLGIQHDQRQQELLSESIRSIERRGKDKKRVEEQIAQLRTKLHSLGGGTKEVLRQEAADAARRARECQFLVGGMSDRLKWFTNPIPENESPARIMESAFLRVSGVVSDKTITGLGMPERLKQVRNGMESNLQGATEFRELCRDMLRLELLKVEQEAKACQNLWEQRQSQLNECGELEEAVEDLQRSSRLMEGRIRETYQGRLNIELSKDTAQYDVRLVTAPEDGIRVPRFPLHPLLWGGVLGFAAGLALLIVRRFLRLL